jgi:GT2 family glycosyltransferase
MLMTDVTIGIPTLNGPDRLARCLESIADCTPFDRFKVKLLVCDDGSTPSNLNGNKTAVHHAGNEGGLREKAGLELLIHEKRSGIAKGWNDLTRSQRSEVTVLLNDDIEVVDHWLDVLVYSVTRNACIGMVALNTYVALTKAQHYAAHKLPPHVAVPRIDYHEAKLSHGGGKLLSSLGSCFAFRTEVYNRVGGFDERYFALYEEIDFGVSCRELGLIHCMASYPIVYHMGGATLSDPKNLDASATLLRSRSAFHEKWGQQSIDQLRGKYDVNRVLQLDEWNTQLVTLR